MKLLILVLFSTFQLSNIFAATCKSVLFFQTVTIEVDQQGEAWAETATNFKKFKTETEALAFVKAMDTAMGIRNRSNMLSNTASNSWSWQIHNLGVAKSSGGFLTSEIFDCP